MKVIVAGGTGLIGRALVDRLVREGHQVWVLTRQVSGMTSPLPGMEWRIWDGQTPQGWGDMVGEVDAIINLAGANIGEGRWTEARKRVLRDSRVDAGNAIVAALQAQKKPPAVLIQIAGVGYYGPRGDELLNEQAGSGSDFLSGVAVDWENSTRAAEALGIRRVVMRTGVVLTSSGGVMAPFLLQHRLFAGGPLGSGKQWISWIHIEDLINCFLFFLERGETHGIYNVTSPQPVTNAAFGKTLGKVLHRPYWAPAPAFAIRLALGEMSTLVLDGQRVIPARLLNEHFSFQFPGLQDALEDLLISSP